MQISWVWTWPYYLFFFWSCPSATVSYCCIVNQSHPKCSGLKEKLLFLAILWIYWDVLLLVSPEFTYAVALARWLGWTRRSKNGLTHMSGTLVLTVSQALSPGGVPFFSDLTRLASMEVQQELKLQRLLLRIHCKLHNVPSITWYWSNQLARPT